MKLFRVFNTAIGSYVGIPVAYSDEGKLFMQWGEEKNFIDEVVDLCLIEMNSFVQDAEGVYMFDQDVVENDLGAMGVIRYEEEMLMWVLYVSPELAYPLIDILKVHELIVLGTTHDEKLMMKLNAQWDGETSVRKPKRGVRS